MRGKTTALGPHEKGLAGIMTRHFFGHFIDELALEEMAQKFPCQNSGESLLMGPEGHPSGNPSWGPMRGGRVDELSQVEIAGDNPSDLSPQPLRPFP